MNVMEVMGMVTVAVMMMIQVPGDDEAPADTSPAV